MWGKKSHFGSILIWSQSCFSSWEGLSWGGDGWRCEAALFGLNAMQMCWTVWKQAHPKALHFSVYVNKGLSFTVIITYTWIFSSEPFFVFSVASFQMLVLGLAVLETRALFFNYYSFTTKLLISRAGVGLSVTSCFCPQKGALGHFGRGRRGLRGSGWVTGGLSVLPATGNRVSSHARRGRELCPWPTNLQLGLWVWEMSAQMAVLGWQQMLLI